MTLTLTADREARVRSVADLRGLDAEAALTALLDQALAEAEAEAICAPAWRTSPPAAA